MAPDRERYETAYAEFQARAPEIWGRLRVTPGIGTEVRAMREGGLRLGIAGQYPRAILDTLDAEGLLEHFEWPLVREDFPLTKPDPRFYEMTARACGVDPADCIMVGDRIDKDVVPARAVGMRTIRIRVGVHAVQEARIPEEMPDVELPSVEGLADAALSLATSRRPS
jgi:FMN phosphatase YigB (HAD superfamily)